MEYTYFGKTGVKVSELCFGTMSFGGDADKNESRAMYDACIDAGVNFFDTANVYQKGIAEEYLGEFIKGRRDELVISSKVYFPMGDGVNDRGASRKHIVRSVHQSLKRLGTDYLDIYLIHKFDEMTAIVETLAVLDALVRQGKILYTGLSNAAAWQVMKTLSTAEIRSLTPIHCIQPMYSLVKRQAEVELLPMAASENLAVMSYSPLGGGLLTGKFSATERPEGARLVSNEMYGRRYGGDEYYEIAGRFTAYAASIGVNPVTLAVSWVKSNPAITAPIIGARNRKQLQASLDAADYHPGTDVLGALDEMSPPPPPATDRSEEQKGFGYEAMLNK